MGLSFEIGSVSYLEQGISVARTALEINSEAPVYDVKRFHPPGTDGNLIVRNGRTGQKIIALVRYIGTVAQVRGYFKADRDAFATAAQTIVDDSDQSYSYCNLTSGKQLSIMKATGRTSGQVFLDVQFVFNVD